MPEETKPKVIRVGNSWVQPSVILSVEKAKSFTRSDGTVLGWIVTLDKNRLGMDKGANPRRWLTSKQVKPILDFFGVEEWEDVAVTPPSEPCGDGPVDSDGEPW